MDTIEQLQEQLARQDKLAQLGTLTAGIAHEVQNPLNFVINFSKLSAKLADDLEDIVGNGENLSEDDREDIADIIGDLKENMAKIQEHGERAISIIRSILLQSRGKAGEFLPTDVANLVHEYVWLSYHAKRATNRDFNVSIHEDYQEGMAKMMVIPQDLSRAVLNVVNNAFDAMTEKAATAGSDYTPTLKVKVQTIVPSTPLELHLDSPSTPLIQISINNNGPVMTEEVKQRLYEKFFTTKPAGKGTGLGMAITKEIIEKNHGGRLTFESNEEEGTTFRFELPMR